MKKKWKKPKLIVINLEKRCNPAIPQWLRCNAIIPQFIFDCTRNKIGLS